MKADPETRGEYINTGSHARVLPLLGSGGGCCFTPKSTQASETTAESRVWPLCSRLNTPGTLQMLCFQAAPSEMEIFFLFKNQGMK